MVMWLHQSLVSVVAGRPSSHRTTGEKIELDAKLIILEKGNHLIARDGFVWFPRASDVLKQWHKKYG